MAATPNTSTPSTQVDNKFPNLPQLSSLSQADQAALANWFYNLKLVIIRQNTTLAAAIDKKSDKT